MKLFTAISLIFILTLNCMAQIPNDSIWWPSKWGSEDQRGAANYITPEKILKATSLIKKGQVYELGRVYEQDMPLLGSRHYKLTLKGLPGSGPTGDHQVVYNSELISGELGQVGTQFDGLGHVGTHVNGENIFYNGFKLSEFGTSEGLTKLGIENVGTIFTRGVLLDIAKYKNVKQLDSTYIISVADIEGTLTKQNVKITEGDVVLFHTGWGQLWMRDNEKYGRSEPGPGITAIKWLIEKGIVMTGADNWGVEAIPGEDPNRIGEGHQWLMNRNGVYNLENLDLSSLAVDNVYEFAFIFVPLKLKGATGSPGNPIAIR